MRLELPEGSRAGQPWQQALQHQQPQAASQCRDLPSAGAARGGDAAGALQEEGRDS